MNDWSFWVAEMPHRKKSRPWGWGDSQRTGERAYPLFVLAEMPPKSNVWEVDVVTSKGIDWQREKWQSGLGSKFIHQGEKNAAKYADEVIVLSKGVQDYFKETYGRETHFIPNGVNRPQIREASLITDKFGLKKDSYFDLKETKNDQSKGDQP